MSQVTITDEEYKGMLEVRLAAKHGFEAGTVTLEQYNAARAQVRRARKVRRQDGAVVETYKQQSAQQHQAMTRRTQEVPRQDTPTLVRVPERRTKAVAA